jgi:hypothetical protein
MINKELGLSGSLKQIKCWTLERRKEMPRKNPFATLSATDINQHLDY